MYRVVNEMSYICGFQSGTTETTVFESESLEEATKEFYKCKKELSDDGWERVYLQEEIFVPQWKNILY